MKIRNVSGYDLLVPALGGRLVIAGSAVEVPDDEAASYTCQTGTWHKVNSTPAKAAADKKGEQQ